MTYTLTGTGSGYWNSQPFINAAFTITFTSDTSTIVHGTSCCGSADSTPSGVAASVSVTGFTSATLTGDQAIFVNRSEQTAGIWHFNSPDYLTVATPAFSNDDLTTPIAPTTGTTFSYATPLPLSTGGALYFTSVQNVYYSQQPTTTGGQVSAVSVTPSSGAAAVNSTQMYTAVVSDSSGAGDIAGFDLQIRNEASTPRCWIYFNAGNNTIATNANNTWGPPTPIGVSGSTLPGDACSVNTTGASVSTSGNNLTLNVPITFTAPGNGINPWPIYLAVQNKENQSSNYTQVGAVTVQSTGFELSIAPTGLRGIAAGSSIDYTVTVTPSGGFSEPVTFSGASAGSSGNSTQLSFAFNPATVSGSGATTMTVTAPGSATQDYYRLVVTGTSQSTTATNNATTLDVATGPTPVTISPTSGSGSDTPFTLTWNFELSGFNLLIASSLDGRNACWIYFDAQANNFYLASDDASSWMNAGPATDIDYGNPPGPGASNSQCRIGGYQTVYRPFGSPVEVTIPIYFMPAFSGTKTLYLNTMNNAGFISGYQPVGGFTAQPPQ